MSIVEKARALAHERHAGMCRPNKARQPVIEHLAEVAALAEQAGCSQEAIAAAWLHDSVEDTNTTLSEIATLCGKRVALLVDNLTDPTDFAALPLEIRKEKQAVRLSEKPDEVKIVKLCDQISNVRSVLNDPPCDWSDEKCLIYINGSSRLATLCAGLSANLDELFFDIHKRGIKKYF